jgi:beta-lactam-binding protein with PASTA domain
LAPTGALAKGDTVTVTYSSGPDDVEVPDGLVGASEQSARAALQNAGLTAARGSTQASATVPEGRIISVSPAEGAEVEPGSTVTYVLSSGPAASATPRPTETEDDRSTSAAPSPTASATATAAP